VPASRACELVIFDCDGVLVDSEPIAVRIDQQVLAQFGIVLTEAEVIDLFLGRSPSVMVDAIEAHLGRPLQPGRRDEYERVYAEAFERELAPVPGVEDALDRIPHRACVASSSEPASLRRKLELTGLYARFAGRMFSASEVQHGKPAPDLFRHAAGVLGADPSRCVVVEDSVYGVQAARAAGMAVLAYVGGGLTTAERLAGPSTTVFEHMRELPGLLGVE
jgi:HAD superfamily hydrolase (TIGR01509 family)